MPLRQLNTKSAKCLSDERNAEQVLLCGIFKHEHKNNPTSWSPRFVSSFKLPMSKKVICLSPSELFTDIWTKISPRIESFTEKCGSGG